MLFMLPKGVIFHHTNVIFGFQHFFRNMMHLRGIASHWVYFLTVWLVRRLQQRQTPRTTMPIRSELRQRHHCVYLHLCLVLRCFLAAASGFVQPQEPCLFTSEWLKRIRQPTLSGLFGPHQGVKKNPRGARSRAKPTRKPTCARTHALPSSLQLLVPIHPSSKIHRIDVLDHG